MLRTKNEYLLHANLADEVISRLERFASSNMRHFVRDKVTKAGLQMMAKSLPVASTVAALDRLNSNVSELRKGFPDLIAFRKDFTGLQFVEIKKGTERLSIEQELWIDFLKQHGIDTRVVRVVLG